MGHWEENPAKWYEQKMIYCSLCGRIIPKMFWIATVEDERYVFCEPDCENLYREYWLPSQSHQQP